MLSNLAGIRARFLSLIILGLLLAPLAGMVSALLFGLISAEELRHSRTIIILTVFVGLIAIWAYTYFSRYFSPRPYSPRHKSFTGNLPDSQQRQLARFGRDYWSFFLLYALATPPLFFLAVGK